MHTYNRTEAQAHAHKHSNAYAPAKHQFLHVQRRGNKHSDHLLSVYIAPPCCALYLWIVAVMLLPYCFVVLPESAESSCAALVLSPTRWLLGRFCLFYVCHCLLRARFYGYISFVALTPLPILLTVVYYLTLHCQCYCCSCRLLWRWVLVVVYALGFVYVLLCIHLSHCCCCKFISYLNSFSLLTSSSTLALNRPLSCNRRQAKSCSLSCCQLPILAGVAVGRMCGWMCMCV